VAGLAVILPAYRVRENERVPLPDFSHGWKFFFGLVLLGFGTFYFINALAPEISPDGTTYHLGLVARYFRQHGLGHITANMYASLSEGLEMLFLSAFSFGQHSSAALIEFACFLMIPLTMVAYSQRFGFPQVGVAAALMIFCSPVFSISGSSAYNDAATVLILFCLFYSLQIWDRTRQPGMLVVAGLLAGFSYGIKYSAFIATPYCIGYVAWKLYRAKKPMVRPLLVVGGCALLLIAPWWIKNLATVGNPLAPFANKVFSNHYFTARFETEYIRGQRWDGSTSDRLIDATIRGGKGGGFLGPLFLLAPISLLAFRYQQGRRLLLCAGLFLMPALANGQTRFLMPSAVFVALSLCLSVWKARGALIAFAIAAPVFAYPPVADVYCDSWAWRLHEFPLADAFRSVDDQRSLEKRLGGYRTSELINRFVPDTGRVFAMAPPQEAYIRPEVLVSYQAAEGENLRDLLYVATRLDFQPSWILSFHFPTQPLRSIRIIQTAARTDTDEWSIGEAKLYNEGKELARDVRWRLSSNANPWDLDYAFDGNPVTRWGSRTAMFSDMQMQVGFGQPLTMDTVELDCSHDQWGIRLKLEGQAAGGNWKLLAEVPVASERPVPENLRHPAMIEFKKHGITHLLFNKGDALLTDFQQHAEEWGVIPAGSAGDDWLYAIK
jgi:hypothetical protein